MSSKVESKFQIELESVLKDLKKVHTNEDKNTLMTEFINQRLNKALNNYFSELEKAKTYLEYRNDVNLLKKYERVMR